MCRDCYKCVRICPVNAIKMKDAQASVIAEKCISCGRCIRQCPQGAKQSRSDVEVVKEILSTGKKAAVSIAPSFVSVFEEWEQKRLPSALRKMGFSYIAETAVGAFYSAQSTAEYISKNPDSTHICSACPVVVNYIEKHKPLLIKKIVPVVSPMIAHAKIIKQQTGEKTPIVFIGPCVGKKQEASRPEFVGYIDAVITFEEFIDLLGEHNIDLHKLEESSFDDTPKGDAQYFPLEGGLLKTAYLDNDRVSATTIALSGNVDVRETFDSLSESDENFIIEPLWCRNGCINGPGMPKDLNKFNNRTKVIDYAKTNDIGEDLAEIRMSTYYKNQASSFREDFSNEEIAGVFERTGKTNPENQLNCGACGYHSCRENAIAVLQGIAEEQMCMPHMRRVAEQKSNTILDKAPNGIIVIDDKLNIISVNPSFKKMFSCTDAIIGKPVSYLIDQDPFEKLVSNPEQVIKKIIRYNSYNLVCNQIHYAIPDENQYIGVFVDITNVEDNEEKLTTLKKETVIQAQELMEHQIEMAQQMAKFLGENTAKGEMLMRNLIKVIDKNS